VLAKTVHPLVYGLAWAASMMFGMFLVIAPYSILGSKDYIPKSDPSLGYYMPKSPLAWFFLILGLALIAVSLVFLALFVGKVGGKKPPKWVLNG
jgi:hypothetical protein